MLLGDLKFQTTSSLLRDEDLKNEEQNININNNINNNQNQHNNNYQKKNLQKHLGQVLTMDLDNKLLEVVNILQVLPDKRQGEKNNTLYCWFLL